MNRKAIVIAVLSCLITIPVMAQQMGNFPAKTEGTAKSSFSLLDPSKFHMTQSYSLMYSSSSRYGSQSLGMYLNSIEYQISDPLKVRFDIGYMHDLGALAGNNSGSLSNNGQLIPGFALSWKPTENFYLHLNYRQVPVSYYSPYDYYDTDYWYPETGRGY